MKFIVIVLCLLSERFLVRTSFHNRFHWFDVYSQAMERAVSRLSSLPWVILFCSLIPMLWVLFLALHFFSNGLFGIVGLFLNILVFYACMGPGNPFYPIRIPSEETSSTQDIRRYLTRMNGELFAVIFWYTILGPLAVLAYRLLSLSEPHPLVSRVAAMTVQSLDWLPSRMTALLYMLVGNFQAARGRFVALFLTAPSENARLLRECGSEALGLGEDQSKTIQDAETLVEHALIALLVWMACFTLVAWI